ncbi:hypothetical protein CPB86DRAFT_782261 [Serendipita vermifera]|nr:hypothetical protein CPB86DRAFT_782261 [Serendipita vermifera]
MSLRDVEQALKALASDKAHEKEIAALDSIKSLAAQNSAEAPQVEGHLLDLYRSNYPVTPLGFFVEALHILREHLTADSIVKNWWYLVLQPALRRQPISRNETQHAIDLVMVALKNSELGFRSSLVQLFIVSIPGANSEDDAIEAVDLNLEERAQAARWKDNLVNVLTRDASLNPSQFFVEIDKEFTVARHRLPLSTLLSKLAAREEFAIEEFGKSPLVMSLLRSLFIDNSATVFTTELTTMTMLIPQFVSKNPLRLREILPELFAILARAICWQPRGEDPEASDIWRNHLEIRDDLQWERLDAAFGLRFQVMPDAVRYFTFLYGVCPANCLAFLRNPIDYLTSKGCQSPYKGNWADALDEEAVRNRCNILLSRHLLHPSVVHQSAEEEWETFVTWNKDVSEVVRICSMLEIRTVMGTLQGAPNDKPEKNALDILFEDPSIGPEAEAGTPPATERAYSGISQRPRISLRSLMETHMALKSGLHFEVAHDFDEDVPSTPLAHLVREPSYEVATTSLSATFSRPGLAHRHSTGSRSPEAISLTSTQIDEARDEAISILQRNLLLIMNELNFETYLRRHYLAQIGSLHRQCVQLRSSEMERQRMRNQIKQYEQEIEQHKRDKRDLNSQIDRYREGGDNYSASMRQQIRKMKQEKTAWLAEAQELRSRDVENRDVLQAQKERLVATESTIFELENEKRENAAKILLIKDYERQIETLRKAEEIWNADHRRLQWQNDIIEQTRSKAVTLQSIIDSEQHINSILAERNRFLEYEIERLELVAESTRHEASAGQNPNSAKYMRESQAILKSKVTDLEQENAKLRSQNIQLQEQLTQEQALREALQVRERLRNQNSSTNTRVASEISVEES